jgi:hypothetical protein
VAVTKARPTPGPKTEQPEEDVVEIAAAHGDLRERSYDPAGALTITGALVLLVYAVVEAPDVGWGDAETILLFAGSAVLLAAFALIESRHPARRARRHRRHRCVPQRVDDAAAGSARPRLPACGGLGHGGAKAVVGLGAVGHGGLGRAAAAGRLMPVS